MMEESDEFNTLAFEKRLLQLKDTQESIQALSSWCLKKRSNHKKIVSSWLNVLKRVKVEQRLTLFYLANDVIQYSKRKSYEFVASWGCYLQKATPLVRDEKVRTKILRIFKIWEQRDVYDEEFLSDLTGLLSVGGIKKTADDDSLDFQPQQLVNKIRQCTSLETDTDVCLKYIHDSHLELNDADALCASLKDKRNTDEVERELGEGINCVEKYTQALQKEIIAREALIVLLKSATQYYSTQRGEVKVVALAYKTFGQRVRQLKRKLDELLPTLASSVPSPPQRDEDVPSPGPDEDFDLPGPDNDDGDVSYNIDKTFNTSLTADGSLYNVGLSSFLGTDMGINIFNESSNNLGNHDNMGINIFNKSTNNIGNHDNMGINIFNKFTNNIGNHDSKKSLKNIFKENVDVDKVLKEYKAKNNDKSNTLFVSSINQQSQETLPGLDLLTPESVGSMPRPTSFYGAIDTVTNEEPESYRPELSNQWPSPNWNNITAEVFSETPESPEPVPRSSQPVPIPVPVPHHAIYTPDLPPCDIDQRGLLPPPPPPPMLPPPITRLEDIDHRMLHSLPPPMPDLAISNRLSAPPKDVDHRNLISLTQPPLLSIPRGIDQDYRVPPPIGPNDIVESVDMDLSEDEELQHMYPKQSNQSRQFNNSNFSDENRRHSFIQNNKVLVGGDNHNNNPVKRTKSDPGDIEPIKPPPVPEPLTAPPIMPLQNPFEILAKFDNKSNFVPPRNDLSNFAPPRNDGSNFAPPGNEGPNYGPPRNDVSNFIPPRSDTSNFVPPRNDASNFLPPRNDVSNFVPPRNDVSNFVPPRNDVSNFVPPRNDVSNFVPPRNDVSNFVPPRNDVSNFVPPINPNDLPDFGSPPPRIEGTNFVPPQNEAPTFVPPRNDNEFENAPNVSNAPNFPPPRSENSFIDFADDLDFDNIEEAIRMIDGPNNDFNEDIRLRFAHDEPLLERNPSPPRFMNPRFQRNWSPVMRGPFRPPFMNQPFFPRGNMRPNRPWMGHRPRFW